MKSNSVPVDGGEKSRIILVIDDTECGRVAVEKLVFLGRAGLRGDVFLVFGAEAEISPIASYKKEIQTFTKLRLRASRIVEFYKDRLVDAGFNVRQVKIFFGNVGEEVLKLEKAVNPDFIMFGMRKRKFFERLLHGDPHKEIIFGTQSPVVVCKPGYEREEYLNLDRMRCTKCAVS